MNKTTAWVLIIAAFLVGGFAGYFVERTRAIDTLNRTKTAMQQEIDNAKNTTQVVPTAAPENTSVIMVGADNDMTDRRGMTLYTYDKDTGSTSNCYGACASVWPPYLVAVPAPTSLPANVGTTKRTDGSLQYTWKGKPVYFYAKDKTPGDVTGDGVGNIWHVAK